jgi:hypothetical protein
MRRRIEERETLPIPITCKTTFQHGRVGVCTHGFKRSTGGVPDECSQRDLMSLTQGVFECGSLEIAACAKVLCYPHASMRTRTHAHTRTRVHRQMDSLVSNSKRDQSRPIPIVERLCSGLDLVGPVVAFEEAREPSCLQPGRVDVSCQTRDYTTDITPTHAHTRTV